MNTGNKDSAEVVNFMTLFNRLKDWSDDPGGLKVFAAGDESVKDLCNKLSFAAYLLKRSERQARTLIAAPANPAFILARRDYEEHYEEILADIWLSDLLPDLDDAGHSSLPKADRRWENADNEAKERAGGIVWAIEFARDQIEQEHRWIDQPEFAERIQDGIDAWERLSEETGFDLHGVFRRRELVPFVLVPRQVSNKHGSAEKLSMLKNLQQAHDAFVFGASFAALALMRSVMEAVLRDHYGAVGKNLEQLISNATSRLPRGASAQRLHRLQDLANAILHIDRDRDQGLPKMDEVRLEKEIVSLLFVLRALIEGAD